METENFNICDKPKNTSWMKNIKESNCMKRVLLGSLMLPSFIILCRSSKIFIIVFIILLTTTINYEIISLAKKPNRPFSLNKYLISYFSVLILTFNIIPSLYVAYPVLFEHIPLLLKRSFYYTLYTLGLIIFISNLKKGKLISQLMLLTIVHVSSYLLGTTCNISIRNTLVGKFYFFYPAILVISNDIFAYVIGKLFGKTPLYALSPKKTKEGFFGASLFTFLTGLFLSYIKLHYGFLPDSLDIKIKKPFSMNLFPWNIPSLYIHNLAFTFGASFVAPFLGFLASAIKRAFKRKDFGHIIPGHGGVTDRMDCQIMMVFFTYFYMQTFLKESHEYVPKICDHIMDSYTQEEINIILQKLKGN